LADRLKGSWTAIYIETSHTSHLAEAERDRIAEALRMAERLGGQAVTLPAPNAADAIIDYARANNFTHVVLSSYPRNRLWELARGSFLNAVIRRAGDINLHIVPSPEPLAGRTVWPRLPSSPGLGDRVAYLGSMAAVIAALMVGEILSLFGITNVALVFLTAVLASAVRYGLLPALFTCILASLAYNFFFLPPLYTFTVADPENVIALFFFAVVAVITSNLTARIRSQAVAAQERAQVTESLYQFSRKLAAIADVDDLLWAAAYQISSMLKVHVVLLLPEEDSLVIRCGYPPEDHLTETDLAAAKWAWTHGAAAGRGADTLTGAKRLFLPLRTGREVVGIVGLDNDRAGPLLTPDQRRLLDALADQIAVAIERILLVDEFDRARIASQAERLQAALLTSLSHDLRTPLASILGSALTLKNYDENLSAMDRKEMLATIAEESERLNRFIANLLDMTRLESGVLRPRLDDVDLSDVIGSALSRARAVLAENTIETRIEDKVPFVKADAVLLEQALFNLLDNAAKHAGPGTVVQVKTLSGDDQVQLIVMDNGPGIPAASLERIFDKFHRLEAGDSKRAGTGLGLAISRGFIEAMGGTVTASNREHQAGATFTITLPQSHPRVTEEGSLS
jgi:two-component system sensor histidine kinase KdpD